MIRRTLHNRSGVTLVELIVAMVVISVAVGGVLMVINYTVLRSADPVLRQQSIAIAEAYMEEISLKNYLDPDDSSLCVTDASESRATFDNICDYNGLPDTVVRDQFGVPIGSLAGYQVAVVVSDPEVTFGNPPVTGLRINVTVTDPAGESLTLSGYRANF